MRPSGSRDFSFYDFAVLVRDLDPQGHMANHVYVAYLSEARARHMRRIDPDGSALRPSVVAEVRCRYIDSLLPWEAFRVGVRVRDAGRSHLRFDYEVRAGDRLIAQAESVEVLIDAGTHRPRAIPASLRARLAQEPA